LLLLATDKRAKDTPREIGLYVTLIKQLLLGRMSELQVLVQPKSPAFVPEIVNVVILKGAVPVFVIVTV